MERSIRETKEIVDSKLPSADLVCKKCFDVIGCIVDGTYLEIGDARFWNPTRGTHKCHKPFFWRPRSDEAAAREGFDGYTHDVLINLGKKGN